MWLVKFTIDLFAAHRQTSSLLYRQSHLIAISFIKYLLELAKNIKKKGVKWLTEEPEIKE